MQVELYKDDLNRLLTWFRTYSDIDGTYQDDDDLAEMIREFRDEAEELESLDFDDCAGGACKL